MKSKRISHPANSDRRESQQEPVSLTALLNRRDNARTSYVCAKCHVPKPDTYLFKIFKILFLAAEQLLIEMPVLGKGVFV